MNSFPNPERPFEYMLVAQALFAAPGINGQKKKQNQRPKKDRGKFVMRVSGFLMTKFGFTVAKLGYRLEQAGQIEEEMPVIPDDEWHIPSRFA